MPKDNLKLISVRLDPDTLERIDAFAKKHTYWKRNTVINQVLTAVFNDFDDRAQYDMTRRSLLRQSEVKAEYEIINQGPIVRR